MSGERVIQYFELDDLPNAPDFFERHSGIDIYGDVNPKYVEFLKEGDELIRACCKVGLVYQRLGIAQKGEDFITLETGHTFKGTMLPRVLANADEIVMFVIAVQGFENFKADDIMAEYFGDTWATAYVEAAQARFGDIVLEKLKPEGKKRTHMWCPGQIQFDLVNQRAIFDILKPEDIGCTLSQSLMMHPVKSGSGLVGIVDKDCVETLKPCDFCTFGKTCPASKRGCASL